MKVVFLISSLTVCGGTHKQLLKLVEYCDKIGVEYKILTKDLDYNKTYSGFEERKNNIVVLNLPQATNGWKLIFRPFLYFYKLILLQKYVSDFDVVNIHDCGFEALTPAFYGKTVVWQVNDLPYIFNLGVFSKRKTKLSDSFMRSFLKFAGKFVTVFTVNVSKNAERVYKVYKKKARVLYCGIEPLTISRTNDNTYERFKKGEINLLSTGVFLPYRNYESLIEVISILRSKGINAHLNIIGKKQDEEYVAKIEEMILQKGLDQAVRICGQVSKDDFEKLHADSDLFLFVNIEQSWGLAIFEAMSIGLPVIVSNSVGATEILSDKNNAIFVDPTDTYTISSVIIDIMNKTDYYSYISSNARNFYKKYSWDDSYCSKMISIMEEYSS